MRLTRDPTRSRNPKSSTYERPNIPSIPCRKHKPLDGVVYCSQFTPGLRVLHGPPTPLPDPWIREISRKRNPTRLERNEPARERRNPRFDALLADLHFISPPRRITDTGKRETIPRCDATADSKNNTRRWSFSRFNYRGSVNRLFELEHSTIDDLLNL